MDVLQNLLHQTAFANGTVDWRSYVMIVVAFVFLYLAIKKGYCGERVWRQSQRRQGLQLSHMTCT